MTDKLSRMTDSQSWPSVLQKLLAKNDLSRAEAAWVMTEIMSGEASEAQVGAFMMALRSKGESVDELAGLVDVMLDHSVILDTGSNAVDIVGTGGDMIGTVNVSTMASIVTSAMGVPVMKHGSRSASGKTGSSEMLEVLGVRLDLSPERVADIFREIGITFFFAPVFHPAMRHVAPIRKQLGVPTTFNFLGPLANPAQPIATSLGVANRLVAPLMAAEVAARGRTALVFRGDDGLDELTTTAASTIWQVSSGEVRELRLDLLRGERRQLLDALADTLAAVARAARHRCGLAADRAAVARAAGQHLAEGDAPGEGEAEGQHRADGDAEHALARGHKSVSEVHGGWQAGNGDVAEGGCGGAGAGYRETADVRGGVGHSRKSGRDRAGGAGG